MRFTLFTHETLLMNHWKRSAIRAAVALTCVGATTLHAQAYWVSATGYGNAFTGTVNNYDFVGTPSNGTGRLAQQSYGVSVNATGSDQFCTQVRTSNVYPGYSCLPSTESAAATMTGSVSQGVVHISANNEGRINPASFTDINGNQVTANGIGQARTSFNGQWGDQITFGGLAPGTPISVVFAMALDGTLGIAGDNYPPHTQDANTAYIRAWLNNPVSTLTALGATGYAYTPGTMEAGFPAGTYTVTGTVYSGTTYGLSGGVELFAEAVAHSPDSPDVTAYVDAGNTVHSFIQVLTPGASFTSASGASYTPVTTTPEPGSLALVGTGLLGFVPVFGRKRR